MPDLCVEPRVQDPRTRISCESLDMAETCVSRHHPNKVWRRESVIASWRSLRREREEALGRRMVPDYVGGVGRMQGRQSVRRSTSARVANTAPPAQKVRRSYSVLHRYDPASERVVTEYKYRREPVRVLSATSEERCASEPPVRAVPKRPARRSLTAPFVTLKTKLLNLFTGVR